jgi:ubiquinol-cytochrome c reductase cytochrome c subunit
MAEVVPELTAPRGAKRRLAFAGVFALFLLPAALSLAVATPGGSRANAADGGVFAQAAQGSLEQAGQQLYLQACSSCHGPGGEGTAQGPAIAGLGPANYDFQMSTGRMPLAQPGTQGVPKPPVLTQDQIDAIVAYLVSVDDAGVPIPRVDPSTGSLSQGAQTYVLNCAPCHSSSGNGGAVGPQVAPDLHHATPTQIAEAVRIGPGTMPNFDSTVVDDRQLASLVRYVLYLRQPQQPGGLSLGAFGPIAEGFVALFIGIASMVLVSRYIGARS